MLHQICSEFLTENAPEIGFFEVEDIPCWLGTQRRSKLKPKKQSLGRQAHKNDTGVIFRRALSSDAVFGVTSHVQWKRKFANHSFNARNGTSEMVTHKCWTYTFIDSNITYEILIIDDNSPDGTFGVAKTLQQHYPNIVSFLLSLISFLPKEGIL